MKMKKIAALVAAMAMSGLSFAAMTSMTASAAATEYPESIKVMLAGSFTGGWDAAAATDANSITITDNGTYTITFDASAVGEQSAGTWALAVRTVDFNMFEYGEEGQEFDTILANSGITLTIDSVKVSGTEKLTGTSTLVKDDDGNNLRANIYNKWGNDYEIIDASQVFDGDLAVTFTVNGLKFGAQAAATDAPTEAETQAPTEAGNTTATTAAPTSGGSTSTTAAPTSGSSGSSGSSTTAAAETTSNASTGDAGVAVAVAALAVAGSAALISRKRK